MRRPSRRRASYLVLSAAVSTALLAGCSMAATSDHFASTSRTTDRAGTSATTTVTTTVAPMTTAPGPISGSYPGVDIARIRVAGDSAPLAQVLTVSGVPMRALTPADSPVVRPFLPRPEGWEDVLVRPGAPAGLYVAYASLAAREGGFTPNVLAVLFELGGPPDDAVIASALAHGMQDAAALPDWREEGHGFDRTPDGDPSMWWQGTARARAPFRQKTRYIFVQRGRAHYLVQVSASVSPDARPEVVAQVDQIYAGFRLDAA